MNWQPISTAPLDGTVILTDWGTCAYVDQSGWGSPVREGWWLCCIGCQPNMNEDCGPLYPKIWMPIPIIPIDIA